jgi:hypothetical protein
LNPLWIALLVAFDIAVAMAVIAFVLRKRGIIGGAVATLGVDLARFKTFSDTAETLVSEYMRANYSGQKESLPGLLSDLMSQLDARAKADGMPLDRGALKLVLFRSISAQRLAAPRDVQIALRDVA